MKFIDLFAGMGGFRFGLESTNGNKNRGSKSNTKELSEDREGLVSETRKGIATTTRRPNEWPDSNANQGTFTCVWSNEWDKYCATIYEKNFGEAPDTRDIRTVPSREIPNHDLLCAGFPCQSFSVAGGRAGFKDTRGTLFFEIARIARDKRSRCLLLENVKGLLSHQEGETFQTILRVLADLGYRCEWQVLNSRNFGVPQNRERVFIVGCLGGKGGPKVFPISEECRISSSENEGPSGRNKVATALTEDYRKVPLNRGETYVVGNIYPSKGQAGQVFDPKGISKAIVPAKRGGSAVMPIVVEDFYPDRIRTFKRCPTLRADRQGLKVKERMKIRRLTPIECERLQGFPDNWTEGVSDTQRYKMLGNAVTVNVVEVIGRKLI